jgi:hypothetical protein
LPAPYLTGKEVEKLMEAARAPANWRASALVNRFEPNRPLAILLMILLVGITAAAVLTRLTH